MMNMRIAALFLICVLFLAGCSPKVTTTLIKAKAPLEEGEELTVLQPEDPELANAVPVKVIRAIGPEYHPLVAMVEKQAVDAGANVVKIENHYAPDIASSKHRIAAIAYWADDSVRADSVRIGPVQLKEYLDVKKETGSFRASVQGGGAYYTAKIPDGLSAVEESHQKNMKWGFTYDAEVAYFFGETVGIGARFHDLHVWDEMPMSLVMTDGSITNGYMKDHVDIWFAGLVIKGRLPLPSRRDAVMLNYGFGIAGESDRGELMSVPYKIKGTTLGHLFEVGYDLSVSKNFAIGASVSYLLGTIRDYTVYGNTGKSQHVSLAEDNFEHLGHVGISIGLRYNL